ncbi:MAG: hypothetical protein HYS17_01770 [Micavibrio aeruginosavorus]|uniref:RcnB family protein n=1 Tax=Micavibrio aeruginosavorus TaxID=349221 RepID=A0A7T5UGR5_9BACT|nr:MAG: hypothetical protein HYS17_01770 [Micavibrio aeruginosavorus]
MTTHCLKIFSWALLMLVVLCLGFAGSAYAEKGGSGKDKSRGHDDRYEDSIHHDDAHESGRGAQSSDGGDDKLWVRIGDDDRSIITAFINDDHRRHCPPGLAKKNNGCLPPGIAKKYTIGQRLPDDVVWDPLPDDLRARLKPVPGYQYVQVDKDILLIGEAAKKVVDAVTLISAVGE